MDGETDISVALVDAQTPGNVGTVARAMKNFGLTDLLLVDPPDIAPGTEAYGFAGRARNDVLADATELSFDELVTNYHTVGFTALGNSTDTKHIRYPIRPVEDLADRLTGLQTRTAIVFGRERIGLRNDELAALNELCTIPANPDYATLNLGQAATIACYELRELTLGTTQVPDDPHPRADPTEITALDEHFQELLDVIVFPAERREKTEVVFRRVIGRADLTMREVSTLHGVLQRCEHVVNEVVELEEEP